DGIAGIQVLAPRRRPLRRAPKPLRPWTLATNIRYHPRFLFLLHEEMVSYFLINDITRILEAHARGDPKPAEELLALVYGELRKLAAHKMAGQAPGHTLQPTALVHEAWLRLSGNPPGGQFAGRAHFFAAAAEAMRHILVDSARRKRAARHGGGQVRV